MEIVWIHYELHYKIIKGEREADNSSQTTPNKKVNNDTGLMSYMDLKRLASNSKKVERI